MEKKLIARNAELLALGIRDYVKSQVDTWKLVPHLALEADGRSGFSDNYARAYRQGVWAIEASVRNGSYTVYVDLASGELVNPFAFHEQGRVVAAYDSDVLQLATRRDQIDASMLVADLKKAAKRPVASYYDTVQQVRWREETRAALKITPVYDPSHRVIAPLSFEG